MQSKFTIFSPYQINLVVIKYIFSKITKLLVSLSLNPSSAPAGAKETIGQP
jgi:hypothetical protein